MKIGLRYREQLRELGAWLLDELDTLIDSLQGAWKVEHTDDDRHGHVHATTLQVGRVSYSSICKPEPFAATVHNFDHRDLRDAGMLRVNTTLGLVSLTGITVPVDELGNIIDGRVLVIENISETGIIALEHQNDGSSPANRFLVPVAFGTATGFTARYYLMPNTITTIQYNATRARWIVISRQTDEEFTYAEFGASQNDYSPAGIRPARVLRLVPTAANLTISGFNSSVVQAPCRKTIINEGVYRFAILHMNTASSAANRVACPGGTMYYLHPRESVDIYFETDGTWHIILKADQWIDVPYAAGNFTASGGGTWTVDAGDVGTYNYQIDGNKMTVAFEIATTDVGGAPGELRIAVPAGRTIARSTRTVIHVLDAGVVGLGLCVAIAGNQHLTLFVNPAGVAWTNTAADNTYTLGQITFMVETSCATVSEPHQDTAHSDTAHGDAGHSDVAHSDVAHVDAHTDVAHSDTAHADSAHSDSHSDVAHSDVAHEDVAHVDGAHQDTAHVDDHTDTTHGDLHVDFSDGFGHGDTHVDVAFFDAHGDTPHGDAAHGDSHSDVAHVDVAHDDTHGDAAHADGGHTDVPFSDSHSDTPHTDVAHVDSAHTDTAHADAPHVDVGLHCDTAHADV